MFRRLAFSLMVLSLLLAACGGGGEESGGAGAGAAQRGQVMYEAVTIGPNAAPGCVACHSLEPSQTLVGPSLAGIGTRAASAVSGQSAEEFLHESIVNPDAHVAEGFSAGIMYANYEKELTKEQIDDLVAYLLTLK